MLRSHTNLPSSAFPAFLIPVSNKGRALSLSFNGCRKLWQSNSLEGRLFDGLPAYSQYQCKQDEEAFSCGLQLLRDGKNLLSSCSEILMNREEAREV